MYLLLIILKAIKHLIYFFINSKLLAIFHIPIMHDLPCLNLINFIVLFHFYCHTNKYFINVLRPRLLSMRRIILT